MSIFASFIIFIISLAILVKSADWLLESAEKIGLKIGLSKFIVGALIVGLGTSLPELSASIAAVLQGETPIVAANAIGSNIANIFLIAGVAAILARKLIMTKNLIELDLPMLIGSTILFAGIAWDGLVSRPEALFLIAAFLVYFLYTLFHDETSEEKPVHGKYFPAVIDRVSVLVSRFRTSESGEVQVNIVDWVKLIVGVAGLSLGAKYLIESVSGVAVAIGVTPAIISITAVAFGTSLPELLVSIKAVYKGQADMAIGNVLGSNIFNILIVTGVPALMAPLSIDSQTLLWGLPMMAMATFFFVVSAIPKRIYAWEGALYVIIYIFFIGKLFGLF